jgi:hypothetical protein
MDSTLRVLSTSENLIPNFRQALLSFDVSKSKRSGVPRHLPLLFLLFLLFLLLLLLLLLPSSPTLADAPTNPPNN